MKVKTAKILMSFYLILAILISSILVPFVYVWIKDSDPQEGRVVAYLRSMSISEYGIEHFDLSKATHIIYAFAEVGAEDNLLHIQQPDNLRLLTDQKVEFPQIKVLLSIGTSNEKDVLCETMRSQEKRAKLVEQCKKIYEDYDLDGFDFDWEYPGASNKGQKSCNYCSKDHAQFLKDLRDVLPQNAVLSYAAGVRFLNSCYDHDTLKNVVDFVNVMNYDFSLTKNSPFGESKLTCFNYLLRGYSKNQINWGIPFYNRCENPDYDYFAYDFIMALVEDGKATLHEDANNTYAMFNGQRLSFDSYNMIKRKTQYAKDHGYGGVFCWHLSCDRDGELMSLLYDIYINQTNYQNS